MRALLREMESNQFALLLAVLTFLLVVMVIGIVVNAIWGVDWSGILGIAGMGTGSHVSTATNQALQARSINYQPLVSSQPIAAAQSPAPSSSGITLPELH